MNFDGTRSVPPLINISGHLCDSYTFGELELNRLLSVSITNSGPEFERDSIFDHRGTIRLFQPSARALLARVGRNTRYSHYEGY